jgi:SsrA-binding protein
MKRIVNRQAHFRYHLYDRLECGIQLTGQEVKSVKSGRLTLGQAFVRFKDHELFLVNAQIPAYQAATLPTYDPSQQRRLLAHKSQIESLEKKVEGKGFSLVPTAAYTKRGNIKVEITLAKGKKQFEKREAIKRHDQDREMARELREKNYK